MSLNGLYFSYIPPNSCTRGIAVVFDRISLWDHAYLWILFSPPIVHRLLLIIVVISDPDPAVLFCNPLGVRSTPYVFTFVVVCALVSAYRFSRIHGSAAPKRVCARMPCTLSISVNSTIVNGLYRWRFAGVYNDNDAIIHTPHTRHGPRLPGESALVFEASTPVCTSMRHDRTDWLPRTVAQKRGGIRKRL